MQKKLRPAVGPLALALCGCTLAAALPHTIAHAQSLSPAAGLLTLAPKSSDEVQARMIRLEDEATLTEAQKLALLRKNIRYVFVLFQENRSFDFYFGTYPGADGLFSKPAAQTPGFVQPIVDTDGSIGTISPFRIPLSLTAAGGKTVPLYPADTDSVDHSHAAYETKIDLQHGVTRNDGYALTEEHVTIADGKPSRTPTLAQKQMGELAMAYVDCDTAPVLWNYADRFTLFDNFHQTVLSASTPNAIAMVAGQSGETQWVKHPEQSTKGYGAIGGNGVPVVSDGNPFWGSQLDVYGSAQPSKTPSLNPQINLTFASLPLSFMGSAAAAVTANDRQPQLDLSDVEKDIREIAGEGMKPTNWEWYQQGYDLEPTDTAGKASHADYIVHHNGPQYFGYVSNNPQVSSHLHGLQDGFDAIANATLPKEGGVFYLRGGYNNLQGLSPVDPNPKLKTVFSGDDDHPGYSDVQIAGALLAGEVNLIAASPYWPQSAIIITYDETDGLYDHAPEVVRSYDPYGEPLDQGPRIPTIVISPYGVAHGISHEASEHSSIIRFIDNLFHLKPLADLPDEAQARARGKALYGQPYLGPADDGVPGVGNLLSAFDNNRLLGKAAPLPASYALLPSSFFMKLPQLDNAGCHALGMQPTDHDRPNPVPDDFNPRPGSSPGLPRSGDWTP